MSGFKWKKDVVELFKLASSSPQSSSLLYFLLPLSVNPNSYHPGSDTSIETKPWAAADAAIYSTASISLIYESDFCLLLFAPPPVLFLFKYINGNPTKVASNSDVNNNNTRRLNYNAMDSSENSKHVGHRRRKSMHGG